MKFALGVEYNGSDFYGWQKQDSSIPTIQAAIEIALSKIADEPIQTFCAGRTDAGVHATGQVIHFETKVIRKLDAWTLGTNTHLPPAIAIKWAQQVDDEFHARFSATARSYRYIIHNHSLRPALHAKRITWFHPQLNIEPMQTAANFLIGELDFSSFRSAQCESNTPMRNVHHIKINRQHDYVWIDIQANAFLHHMVRNIVGVLLQIGTGEKNSDWMQEVLQAKDRRVAGMTAPPNGLYLNKVFYPPEFALPELHSRILLL